MSELLLTRSELIAERELAAAEIERLEAEAARRLDINGRLRVGLANALTEIGRLRAALEAIEAWSCAYPLSVFPEPDFEKAAELLQAGGITLDAVSASCMRLVVQGVGEIARKALRDGD